ncbi:MAG TPA: glycosyltransferase family 39 protein [Thermoleophilaceae bacterium]|nr:glycosyltransferase family 39 protein [Thermoleophilaceae bacterium]
MGIVVLALVVRLVAAVAVFDDPLAFDPRDYDRYARSIATGDGYPEAFAPYQGPTAYRPPAFPVVLGAVYAVRGGADPPPDWSVYLRGHQPDQRQVNAGRIAQALLGTAAVAMVGLVAFQLFGARVALLSLGLGAVYPPFVIVGLSLFSEPLFILLVLAAVAAALRARAGPTRVLRWAAVSGAFAGLAWLTRSNGFVVLPALCLLVWTVRPRLSRTALAAPAVLLGAVALVVGPWTVRNAVTLDAFIPVSSEGGYTLAGTYNDTSRNSDTYPAGWIPAERDLDNARIMRTLRDDGELSSEMMRQSLEYIGDHPAYVGKVAYCNTMRMIYLERLGCGESGFGRANFIHETRIGDGVIALAIVSFAALALLALGGAATRAARAAPLSLWLVPLSLATVVLVVSGNRLRAPIEPFMIMLAALALARLTGRFRRCVSA